MGIDLSILKEEIIQTAHNAADEIMKFYNNSTLWDTKDSDFFSVKEDYSPVTLADQAADNLIVESLKKLTPNIPILSEEGGQKLSQFDLLWLVDPLDGTRQFVKRKGNFTVNIALLQKGFPVLGVVYEPLLQKLYVGIQGQQKRNSHHSSQNTLKICHGSFTQRVDLLQTLFQLCEDKKQIVQSDMVSSSLKYCLVSDHSFDVAISMHKMSSWDIAAAHAVVSAAGGLIGIWTPETQSLKEIDYIKTLETGADILPGVVALSKEAADRLEISME